MSRVLKQLREYDNSVTVGELIQKLEQEEQLSVEKELKEEENIKAKFENKYFKHLDEQYLFGVELQVYKFKNLVRKETNTGWVFIYYFNGSELSFSEREAFMRDFDPDRSGNSFSAEDLKEMVEITEEDYNQYLEKYKLISNELKEIVNGKKNSTGIMGR
jgi:hypothetical protein